MMRDLLDVIKEHHDAYFSDVKSQASQYDSVIIYGAGVYGRRLFRELQKYGVRVECFCVTHLDHLSNGVEGVPVFSLAQAAESRKKTLYLLAANSEFSQEMERELMSRNIESYILPPRYFEEMFDDFFARPVLEITPKAGCSVNCKYCPQEKFLRAYHAGNRSTEMGFEVFKQCLDKTPQNLAVDFSGFVEPFLAKDAVRMMQYAAEQGRDMRLFTTLVGLTKEKFDAIKEIPFKFVMLHLPDQKGYAHIPTDDAYFSLLAYVMETKKADGSWFVNEANCQYEPIRRAEEMVREKVKITWDLIDRAGNLSGETLDRRDFAYEGEIYCSRAAGLNHNILLPNGDVVLCCMDFGMRHILGNLCSASYEEIFAGENMKAIRESLPSGGGKTLCGQCTAARKRE